jgi:nicotinate-nucleotide pyrophosphorylase (carboxylating)
MISQIEIDQIILNAFNEDIGNGDITTIATVSQEVKGKAEFLAKADGIIAGLDIVERAFHLYDSNLVFEKKISNGDNVKIGEIFASVTGKAASILTVERTALNILQRMSGIATYSNRFSEAVKHTKAKIIDTRKTIPGLRSLDKLAVTYGGCSNHRIGLYDMFLIKDNHIAAAGSITNAVNACKNYNSRGNNKFKIEVEVTNLQQTREALDNNVDVIMLDNFNIELMKEAVNLIDGKTIIEASGGVNLATVKEIAETGVDLISIGAITHSVQALDISLNLSLILP